MTTKGSDLTDFLLERIEEEEQAASGAAGLHTGARLEGQPPLWVGHVATWAPQRVLADCEARRRILTGCVDLDAVLDDYGVPAPFRGEDVLRWLALPYAAHEDYRLEWRPGA
jgi:hypothetical protein